MSTFSVDTDQQTTFALIHSMIYSILYQQQQKITVVISRKLLIY